MIAENEILSALKELYKREKTQKALSELAGVTQSTINAYLNGKAKIENMPVGVFLRLFRDMKIDYFGTNTGNSEADLRRSMYLRIFEALSPEEQMRCLALVIATFPEKAKEENKRWSSMR